MAREAVAFQSIVSPSPPNVNSRRKHEFVLGARNAPSAVSLDRRVSMRVCHRLVERQRSIRHRFHPLSEDDQTAHRARAFRPASARPLWERWGRGEYDQSMGSPGRSGIASLTLVVSLLSLTWGAPLAVGLILGEQRPSVDAGESECCVGGDKDGCCYSARQNTTSLHSLLFKGNKEEVERSLDATNWEKGWRKVELCCAPLCG